MSSNAITPGMVIGARYRVVKQLGEGGVGAVYLVQHVHTDERLALKVLHSETRMDPSTVERFRNEARAPARIDSDHIARVTDADVAPELNGAPFLVMEYLRGRDLSGEGQARGALHPKEVVLYLRQAARALDKAHGLGIIHRDLKPENIFLTVREDGTPCIKLLDFGIAKLTGSAASSMSAQSKTKTGAVFGTPLYMSPEQARAHTHLIGPHTDVWAIGLIAARLLLGFDYWQAETISELVVQIVVDPIPSPSQRGSKFGPAFDAWFLRCCNRDIAQRFRSVGDAITELATSLGVVEGPKLVLEVTEILERARAAEGPSKTLEAAPLALSPSGFGGVPAATPAPNPSTHVPVGAAPISPSTVMGSTQVASTAMGMQASTTGAPVRTSASNKTPFIAAIAVLLVGLIGGFAILGLRKEDNPPKNAPAGESEVVPLPTPQPKVAVPADPPSVEPTAPIETAAVSPSASAAPAQGPTKAANTAANTTTNSGHTKTSPVPTTTNKKPNDDDLMSGRR